jgi:hypothetical protein
MREFPDFSSEENRYGYDYRSCCFNAASGD